MVSTPTPPGIVDGPASTNVVQGGVAIFSVAASGSAPLAYQWRFKGTNLVNQTNASLVLSNVQDSNTGVYNVRVTNLVGSITSADALLSINHPPIPNGYATYRFVTQGVKFRAIVLSGTDPDGDPVTLSSIASGSVYGGSIFQAGNWVAYLPPEGFTNADSFSYQVSDGRGGSATGTITIAVTNDPQVAENLIIEAPGDGSLRLRFFGIPGRSYGIEATDNLSNPNWETLGRRTANPDGTFEFVDPAPAASLKRFYRSVYP